MAIERIRVWVAFDTLTAAALNAEYDNIIDYINALEAIVTDLEARVEALENP